MVEVDLGWTKATEKAADDHMKSIFGASGRRIPRRARQPAEQVRAGIRQSIPDGDHAGFSRLDVYRGRDVFDLRTDDGKFDVFICPTLALPSVGAEHDPANGLSINGKPVDPRYGWIMTYPFNMLSRCPVLSVPSGHAKSGIPTGNQIVGKTYSDADVFRAGLAFEEAVGGWFTKPQTRPVAAAAA